MPCSFLSWVTPSRSVRRRWPPLAFRLIAFPVQCFTTCPGWGLSLSYHLFLDPVGFLSPMPPPICYPARRRRPALSFFPFHSPLCVFVVSCLLVVSNRPRGLSLFPVVGVYSVAPGAFRRHCRSVCAVRLRCRRGYPVGKHRIAQQGNPVNTKIVTIL